GDGQRLLGPAKADHIGQARIGGDLAMGDAHAATDGDIEPFELARRAGDGDEAEIVGVDVDIVARRYGDGNLELAWQVALAVERLALPAGDLVAIEPDFVIGAGGRQEVI